MSEYGSGVSLTQAFNYDKERLVKALTDNELVVGENQDGFIYEKATENEVKRFILDTFDNAVYHALQGYASGKALKQILTDYAGANLTDEVLLVKYRQAIQEVEIERIQADGVYHYERDLEDDYEEG